GLLSPVTDNRDSGHNMRRVSPALSPNPPDNRVNQLAFALVEPVKGACHNQASERAGTRRVQPKRFEQLVRSAVEVLVPASDDRNDRRANRPEGRPASIRSVVREYVFCAARSIEAQVAAGAPEAPGAGHERVRIALGDPLREQHALAERSTTEALGFC